MDGNKIHVSFNSENLAYPEIKVETEMRHITFTPQVVCSQQIDFDLDSEDRIHNLKYIRGCNGNLKAIGKLVEGKPAAEIADILRGNDCQNRGTSCADQLAKANDRALA